MKKMMILGKNGIEINLVPLDAEFFAEQHIQNPLKSVVGKNNYSHFYFKISIRKYYQSIFK